LTEPGETEVMASAAPCSRKGHCPVLAATLLIIVILNTSCGPLSGLPNPTSSPIILATSDLGTPTEHLSLSADGLSRQQEIIHEILLLVSEYDQTIEHEILTGEIEGITIAADGTQAVHFSGESLARISAAYDRVLGVIGSLNGEYLELYRPSHQPTPYPSLTSFEATQLLFEQAMDEYGRWVDDQRIEGTVVRLFEPFDAEYQVLFIADTYAQAEIWWRAIVQLQIESSGGSPQEKELDILAIKRIDPAEVAYVDVVRLPYRMDVRLYQYQTDTRRYTVFRPNHEIIEIIPIGFPYGSEGQPLTDELLMQMATDLIASLVPALNLSSLAPAHGEKSDTNVFFRWEDLSKPPLDDGRSYPFIQVGLTRFGELLNYVNTLPLSR